MIFVNAEKEVKANKKAAQNQVADTLAGAVFELRVKALEYLICGTRLKKKYMLFLSPY